MQITTHQIGRLEASSAWSMAGRGAVAVNRSAADAAWLAISATALGIAMQVNFGQYHPLAITWLSAAGIAALAGIFSQRRLPLLPTLAICLAVQFIVILISAPVTFQHANEAINLLPFRTGIVIAALATAAAIFGGSGASRIGLAVMLLMYLLLGLWTIRVTPLPGVDVIVFQQDAASQLLAGKNPYDMTFADPYDGKSDFYGFAISRDGRLQFGFPYPPLPLLLSLPGHLMGDVRLGLLVAMAASGLLIARMNEGPIARAAAALVLFTPRGFFALEAGWIEPYVILVLVLVVYLSRGLGASHTIKSTAFSIALGLFLVSKQYLVLALPAVLLLPSMARPTRWRTIVIACVAGAAVTLPLALWNLPAFMHSVVFLQFRQPFRPDALSYLVPLSMLSGVQFPAWLAFAGAGITALIVCRRFPATPSAFAAATALIFLVFFALNKQAFCNYYCFVVGAMAAAISTAAPPHAIVRHPERSAAQ